MKKHIVLFALLCGALLAEEEKPEVDLTTLFTIQDPVSKAIVWFDGWDTPERLNIGAGDGAVSINFKTGEVKLPDGVKLPDAALQFWKAVAEAFPEFKRVVIEEHNKEQKQ